jgi:hypothetical protein
MTYRFYLTVTPFHATVACDSRSPPSSVRSALTLSPARPRRSPLADPARCGAPPSPATTHYPPPVTHCLFVCPLFSHTYKSLGGQPLYFHIHTKPPGVYPLWASVLRPPYPLCCAFSSTPLPSNDCSLFVSLRTLFCIPFLCFQPVAASFSKYPGVWVFRTVLRGHPGVTGRAAAAPHYSLPATHFLLLIQPPAWKKQVRGYQRGFWTIRSAGRVPVGVFRGVPIPAPFKKS